MSEQKDERKFWLEWLDRYKSLRCLWDTDARRRVSKYEINEAYQELADLAKFVIPKADINYVRKRINSLRTSYRREYKKVEAAKANGIAYTPCLFYYDTIKQFVNPESDELEDTAVFYDEESENDPISSPELKEKLINKIILKNDPTKNVLDNFLSYNFDDVETEITRKRKNEPVSVVNKNNKTSSNDYVQTSAIKRKYEPTQETESVDFETSYHVKTSSIKPFESSQDEYDILGKRIAEHFRNMKQNQRLFAEKIISDVCIYGRMEKLSMDSTLVVESDEEVVPTQSDAVDYENPDTYIYNT